MKLMNRNDVKKVIEDLTEKPFVCAEHYIETTSGFIITTKEKSKYHRATKQTNADRIRSMSDEELAEFLADACVSDIGGTEECIGYCKPCFLQWLKSEVKE